MRVQPNSKGPKLGSVAPKQQAQGPVLKQQETQERKFFADPKMNKILMIMVGVIVAIFVIAYAYINFFMK